MNIHVTAKWIKEYAQSIEAPLQKINGKLIAPSTMPIIFWTFFDVPLLKQHNILHGSQQFIYNRPIQEGMVLQCELALTNIEQKMSKSGAMTLYTYTLICMENETEIAVAKTVLIQVGESS